jgi:hypothetical protein
MDRFRGMAMLHVPLPAGRSLAVFVAERRLERLVGLAGLRSPPPGGLLIPRCRSVHTFGMRFPLAILFVTLEGNRLCVHDAHPRVPPRRVVVASRAARERRGLAALELGGGHLQLIV